MSVIMSIGAHMFLLGICMTLFCLSCWAGNWLGEWVLNNRTKKPFLCFSIVLANIRLLIVVTIVVLCVVFGVGAT